MQNTRFSRLKWVTNKSPGLATKTLKDKIVKKISKCFSRLGWVANKSPSLAAKTLKNKIMKNFLRVFCDWKVYPRGSRELSRENLCVPLATGPFTREQVAKNNMRARG